MYLEEESDKRTFPRMRGEGRVNFRVAGQSDWLDGALLDLSGSGLALVSAIELPVDSEIEVRIVPEMQVVKPFAASARVVRCQRGEGGYQVACNFTRIEPADYPAVD